MGPYGENTLRRLVPEPRGPVIDIGCGKGAALAAFGGEGIGLEINPEFAADARRANPQAEIREGDAKEQFPQLPEPGLVLCLGASQALGEPEEAIGILAEKLRPGGILLFGDGYWRQTPAPEYLEFLGCTEADIPTFEAFKSRGRSYGLEFEEGVESTAEDWDAYEDSYYQSVVDWCDRNSDDPDSDGFRARIEGWRSAYLTWGRGTLGFGIVRYRKSG